MKLPVQIIQLACSISLALLSFTPVRAQPLTRTPIQNSTFKPSRLVFKAPPLPRYMGAPGQRTGLGSRGCGNAAKPLASEEKGLIALVPVYGSLALETAWGLTTAERTTFWFYVPYSSAAAEAEFVLEDAAKHQTIHKVQLAEQPGVVGIPLPSTSEVLQIGKPYHWYFNIYCQKNNRVTAFVEGDVQRQPLSPALKRQLDTASPQQRVALYAASGIWYEALTTLAELRLASPQDANLATDWASLLRSVGLENTGPVVDCCKP